MKISELPEWTNDIPFNTWSVIAIPQEGNSSFKNFRIDMSKLAVGGGGSGSGGGLTEEDVRKIIREEIGEYMTTLASYLDNTLSGVYMG